MIVGIGCDIVDHHITSQLNWNNEKGPSNRIFSKREIDLYNGKKELRFLAGRFAAKEALLKCIGTGMQDGISLTHIEILQLNNGSPIIELTGEVKKISVSLGINRFHISISHSEKHSIAFIVAEK